LQLALALRLSVGVLRLAAGIDAATMGTNGGDMADVEAGADEADEHKQVLRRLMKGIDPCSTQMYVR
jgi:hypothetical protein